MAVGLRQYITCQYPSKEFSRVYLAQCDFFTVQDDFSSNSRVKM